MKGKTLYIVIGLVVAVIIGWYLYSKKATAATASAPGSEAWEKEVARNMAWMKNDAATIKLLKEKAAANKITYDLALRRDAEWYAEKNGFVRPV